MEVSPPEPARSAARSSHFSDRAALTTDFGILLAVVAAMLFAQRFLVVGPMMMDGHVIFEGRVYRPPTWSVAVTAGLAVAALVSSARRTRSLLWPATVGVVWLVLSLMAAIRLHLLLG